MPDLGPPASYYPAPQCPALASSGSRPGVSSLRVRESCQACAISKVRCTKERPSCSKCQNRGIPCQYFLARRPGRRPERRGMASGAGLVLDSGPSHRGRSFGDQSAVRPAQQSLASGFGADPTLAPLVFSEADSLHFTFLDAQDAEVLPMDDILGREAEADSEMNTPFIQDSLNCDSNFEYTIDEDDLWRLSAIENGEGSISTPRPCVQPSRRLEAELSSTISHATSNEDFLGPASASSLLGPQRGQPLHQIIDSDGPTDIPPCACFVRALDVLKMPLAVQPCHRRGSPGRDGMDGVDGNRDAIEAVSSGLNCSSCSRDSSSLMILAMIVLKVLDRYVIMGRRESLSMTGPVEPQDPATLHWCSDDDDDSRGSVGIEVGLAEIYHVQEVVRDLCRRLNDLTKKGGRVLQNCARAHVGSYSRLGTGERKGRVGEADRLFSASTLQHIQLDLCRQLGSLSTEVVNCLRREA